MLAQILIVFGATLMGLLGTLHIIYTFFTNKLEPRDAATAAAMKATNPILTRRVNFWDGWIGFNASHGLGIALFAATYLLLAVGHPHVLAAGLSCTEMAARCRLRGILVVRPLLVPDSHHWPLYCNGMFPGGRIRALLLTLRHVELCNQVEVRTRKFAACPAQQMPFRLMPARGFGNTMTTAEINNAH